MTVEIPDTIIAQAGLSSAEFLLKIAILLFEEEKLSLGQASKLAGLHQAAFQKELARREISLHYGRTDFTRDLETIASLK